MDLGPKIPSQTPMDCNKIDNAMPGSLHQHPEGLPMKQSSKQLTFLFKHRKVKEMILTQPTQPTQSGLTNSLTNGCNIPQFHNESMNQKNLPVTTCNYS